MNSTNNDIPQETLIEVAQQISEEKKTERKIRFPYPAQARLFGTFNGAVRTYWLTQTPMQQSMYDYQSLVKFGQYIPKNSNAAIMMLNRNIGELIEYDTKVQHCKVVISSRVELSSKTIAVLGDRQLYSYEDIDIFLAELVRKRIQIEEAERLIREKEEQKRREADAHKRGVITKEIKRIEEEKRILTLQQEELSNLTKYIREQGKLRFNPILDPVQNRIKTSHLYDGTTLVIDGGPGTGKTTTMIQRLKYLTDDFAIKEDTDEKLNKYNLTASQRQRLFDLMDSGRDWMFFSPSELLKEYLSEAMNKEGLANTRSKVWNWQEYLKKVTREYYQFIDPNNENTPFLASRSSEMLILPSANAVVALTDFYLTTLKNIKNNFPTIDDAGVIYKWKSIALRIKQQFDLVDNFSIEQFIRLFNSLEQLYAADCREILAENRATLKQISEDLYVLVRMDEGTYNALVDLLQNVSAEQTDDADEDVEETPDDFSDFIISAIRNWFKRYCYSTVNSSIKLTSRQQKIGEMLLPLMMEEHKNKVSRVGELALFEQYAKYSRGVVSNMFTGIPAKYKRFRRAMLNQANNGWDKEVLKALLQRRGGKELHHQEQALLIGFVNNLAKKTLNIVGTRASHTYIEAYKELARPIIGIDESTDFCKTDIYAMASLLTMDFNSLTLCGDMMQRLTKHGIRSWDDLDGIVSNMTVVKMRTSYRQSVRLLEVAKSLYKDSIGEEPEYKAYLKSKKVPDPLAVVSDDEDEKIIWIEQRIKEIYDIYKRLPSIAIFLNDANDIRDFVIKLKDTDFFIDTDIEVVDGSSGRLLASSNQIRVYPIDVVKGMEFDVVFFHNIDSSHETLDMIKRYIYVGVSRAAFFLGATFINEDKDLLQYFELGKGWKETRASRKTSVLSNIQSKDTNRIEQNEESLETPTDEEMSPSDISEEKVILEPLAPAKENRHGKRWTQEEEAHITAYFNMGYPISDIASATGRTEVAINLRLTQLGLIEYEYNSENSGDTASYDSSDDEEDYIEDEAMEESDDVNEEGELDFYYDSDYVPKGKLKNIPDTVSNSFGFLWMLALLDLMERFPNTTSFDFDEMAYMMIAEAWTLIYGDKSVKEKETELLECIEYLIEASKEEEDESLSWGSTKEYIYDVISLIPIVDKFEKMTEKLLETAPYDVLRAWFGAVDENEIIERSSSFQKACLYSIVEDKTNPRIELNKGWRSYLHNDSEELWGFFAHNYLEYLEEC